MAEKPDKLRAEWFWTDRWFASTAIELEMEPRGLYREMLTRAWSRGARLPNDPATIQRVVGCTTAEWKRCWPKVQPYWRVDGDSLVNDTQLEVYAEAVKLCEGNSQRGKRGAQARWHKPEHYPSNAQAMPEHVLEHVPEQNPEDVLGQCPPSLSPIVPPKDRGEPRPRARGAGNRSSLAGADSPLLHGECLAHGPVCLKPPVVEHLNLLASFAGDRAALVAWAERVCDRWRIRVDAGARVYTVDQFEFWRTEYKTDFGATKPRAAAPAAAVPEGRSVAKQCPGCDTVLEGRYVGGRPTFPPCEACASRAAATSGQAVTRG